MTGGIEMEQPGRRAMGERLVYTADEGTFVLTGTNAAPPKIMDDVRGMVTGASLQFRSGDESGVVSNGASSGAGQRVRTETRVKKYR
jgi:lipopolysaccharide export system protein LptA